MGEHEEMSFCFIDSFSALDELRGKDRADPLKILSVLAKVGRFSCFEVDDRMAAAMTMLCNSSGWIECQNDEIVEDADGHGSHTRSLYPWTRVKLTNSGRHALSASAAATARIASEALSRPVGLTQGAPSLPSTDGGGK